MRAISSKICPFLLMWQCSVRNCDGASPTRCSGVDCGFEVVADSTSLLQHGDGNSKEPPVVGEAISRPAWETPVTFGLLLGLLLIGPDHLGTLMALSTLTSGLDSFKVGFAWGFGHSMGMIIVCPVFLLLRHLSTQNFGLSMHDWEYFGDHVIGISMVLIGVYFLYNESSYLELQKDGTYKAKACSCCVEDQEASAEDAVDAGEAELSPKFIKDAELSAKFCKSYGVGRLSQCTGLYGRGKDSSRSPSRRNREGNSRSPSRQEEMVEETPLLQSQAVNSSGERIRRFAHGFTSWFSQRSCESGLLGAMQGLCCPMGLAGLGFLGRMTMTSSGQTTTSGLLVILFVFVFVLSSALGSGVITLGWGLLTSNSESCVSSRTMFRASCAATCGLGVLWIVANFLGVLDKINFTDHKIHETLGVAADHM